MESEDNVAIYPSSHDSILLLKVYHRVRWLGTSPVTHLHRPKGSEFQILSDLQGQSASNRQLQDLVKIIKPPEKAVLVLLCIIYGKLMLRVLLYTAFHLVHAHARVYNSRQQEQYDCAEPNSERCIQKGAEILCIYADIVLENLPEQRQ